MLPGHVCINQKLRHAHVPGNSSTRIKLNARGEARGWQKKKDTIPPIYNGSPSADLLRKVGNEFNKSSNNRVSDQALVLSFITIILTRYYIVVFSQEGRAKRWRVPREA